MKGIVLILVLMIAGFVSSGDDTASVSHTTGSVEGVVVLAPKQIPVRFGGSNRYGRPALRQGTSDQSAEDSVLIWLKGTEGTEMTHTGAPVILDQKEQKFNPVLLPIRQHGTVRILNSDPVYHNVFSLSGIKKFDVGRRPRGEYKEVVFDKPGLVNVFCDIHSNMHAVIYVMGPEVLKWSKIKNGESFTLGEVPPGSYHLSVYSLGYEIKTIPVEIISGQSAHVGTITLAS